MMWPLNDLCLSEVQVVQVSEVLMSFQELQNKFHLNKNQSFKYLQVRSFISLKQNNQLSKATLTMPEKMLIKDSKGKGIISDFYNLIISQVSEVSYGRLRAWRDDLSLDLMEEN